MQQKNYFSFNILLYRIEWDIVRIVWIGFYKNDFNNNCFFNLLSNDLIKHIIKFIGIPKKITHDDGIIKNDQNQILALEI